MNMKLLQFPEMKNIKGKNITNINVQNYDDLPEIIENLNGKIMFGLTMSQIFEMNYF